MAVQRKPVKRGESSVEHHRPLGRLCLYRDDLDDIHAVLSERTKSVSLTANRAIVDAPDELRGDEGEELSRLRFVTSNPDIVVTLTSTSAVASTSDESPEAIAIIDDLQALLKPRRRGVLFLSTYILRATSVTAAVLCALLLITLGFYYVLFGWAVILEPFRDGSALAFFAALSLGPLTAVFAFFGQKNVARIILERRGRGRGFSVQTRHDWLIAVTPRACIGPWGLSQQTARCRPVHVDRRPGVKIAESLLHIDHAGREFRELTLRGMSGSPWRAVMQSWSP